MKAIRREKASTSELQIKFEMIGIAFLFLAIFVFLSLISFSPLDPSFFHSTLNPLIRNYGGKLGAELSAVLFNLWGLASFLLVIFLLLFTIHFFMNRGLPNIWSKSIGLIFLITCFSSFLAWLKPAFNIGEISVKSGGFIGFLLNDLLVSQIHRIPAFFLEIALIVIALMIITKVSLKSLFMATASLGKKISTKIWGIIEGFKESRQKQTRYKQLKRKYDQEIEEPDFQKKAETRPIPDVRNEKRALARQPSKIPEETYLFSDLDEKNREKDPYQPPPITFLDLPSEKSGIDVRELEEKKRELAQRLQEFRIHGEIFEYTPGPVITTYEFVPDVGVKVKDVANLTEDLALVVKAQYVRIERILGKKAIGIEIPNKKREIIHLRELLESSSYRNSSSPLTLAIGKTTSGDIFISDLREMPHLLVAGATGSGKSVAIHSIILSILYKSSPQTVKFVLIDPKRIELTLYNSLPHLLTPVVVNPKLAKNALDWAVWEMENRYKKLATLQVRSIEQYNRKLMLMDDAEKEELTHLEDTEPLPYIVIIIDELADLMMVSAREIEENIARLAQKSRAVGIHLILATQRPSIDVITGTIKNNFPSRIALAVPSKHDSRTIIDQMGAEKLLGNGDMLFLPPKTASLIRLHGAYVSEQETLRIVNHLARMKKPEFNSQVIRQVPKKQDKESETELDDLFYDAAEIAINSGHAAASHLQRKLSVGYARAARLMDQLEGKGVISAANSRNQREILITMEELHQIGKNEEDSELDE